MKHYTTIEQSKKLLSLGIKPETADMHYSIENRSSGTYSESYKKTPDMGGPLFKEDIPCWSQGALMDIMPEMVLAKNKFGKWKYYLNFPDKRTVEYGNYNKYMTWNGMINYASDNFTESLYNILVWVIENKYYDPSRPEDYIEVYEPEEPL